MFFSRGPNKTRNPYNLADMYPSYVKHIESTEPYIVSKADFIEVCGAFNKEIVNQILHGKTFYLPSGLGHIDVEKFKSKNPRQQKYIDWPATVELGKRVWHTNPHSSGYRYRIVWWRINDQNRAVSRKYFFVGSRLFKRTLAKLLKEGEVDFFQSDFTGKSLVMKRARFKRMNREKGLIK